MTKLAQLTVLALALSTGAAFAKAHDQGVADGGPTPENTGQAVQNNGVPGISANVNKGARGAAASAARSGNRIEPVVGNGNK